MHGYINHPLVLFSMLSISTQKLLIIFIFASTMGIICMVVFYLGQTFFELLNLGTIKKN
jgi:hypothetical protein